MDDQAHAIADTLELLHLNQIAIRAALEELSLWISLRGSIATHKNVAAALSNLDINTEIISSRIESLRM